MAKKLKLANLVKGWKRMIKNQRGNVAMMFGLSAVPIIVAGGAAIDYDRAINAKTALQASLDTAILFAAKNNSSDMSVLTAAAQPFLNVNYKGTDATVTSFAVSAGTVANSVKATATISLNTWFMSTIGINSMNVTTSSEALHVGTGRNVNLEISLVLDNTGSMNTPGSGFSTKPIDDLKVAATNFVNTLMAAPQTPYFTKIAVVPYNNSVNMGTSALATTVRGGVVAGSSTSPGSQCLIYAPAGGGSSGNNTGCTGGTNGKVSRAITTCVTERTGAQAYTDASALVYPVGRQYGANINPCTNTATTPMLPLSTSTSTILSTVSAMSAGNYTAGHIGIAWGWYTLSPNFGIFSGASVPVSYSMLTTTVAANKTKKVMVLMTDGEYNSSYAHGVFSSQNTFYGTYSSDSINLPPDNGDPYVQSNAMCTAIKASGVEVYTIAFQLDQTKPQRVALLANCATDAAHALVATDQSQLNAVFQSLAQSLATLRLTN